MRTLSIALILIMAFAVSAQAATPAYGLKGGVTFANLSGDYTDGLSSKTGFMIGGFADIPLSPNFSIQPEALYVQKGAKEDDAGTTIKLNLNYLEIPVLAKYTFAGEKARPYLMAGPALGFKLSSTVSAGDQSADVDDIKSTDFSLVFGAGVNIQKFLIEVRYDLGLSSIDDSPDPDSVKNNFFGVLVGYSF